MDIYSEIWRIDQNSNGLKPILINQEKPNSELGYVVVDNTSEGNKDKRILNEVLIPKSKKLTYDLCVKLFDNFSLSEKDEEFETPEEREEIHDFVSAIIETPPMLLAKEYISEQLGTSITKERWHNTVMELWFRRFSQNGEPHLSGFEHVIVGEQDGPKAQGYHFWYKYYLDDGFANIVDGKFDEMFPALYDDRIDYHSSKMSESQLFHPESVTISYKWDAADYDRGELRPLHKKIGGFFVGCSVEGLMAIGTVRAHVGIKAPKKTIINGAEYDLVIYRNQTNQHIRTFYPKFIRSVESENSTQGSSEGDFIIDTKLVRIIAALINPLGDDPGKEKVTIINITKKSIDLSGWHIMDKNNNSQELDGEIASGQTKQILLDKNKVQLSNKGGTIRLISKMGTIMHMVSYSKGQVSLNEGNTILF